MEDTPPVSGTNTPPAPAAVRLVTNLDPVAVFAALASELRWAVLQMLATGQRLTASDVAAAFRREFDGVSKHMRVMRDAGVVSCEAGEDRRQAVYFIPAIFRATPGVIDYGVCQVRVPEPPAGS